MARTPSTMLDLGTAAPDFKLPEPKTHHQVALNDFTGNGLVVAFICNHCPYVIQIINTFSAVATRYQAKGIDFVAINSNDIANYPDDSPEKMVEFAQQSNFTFPYLFDDDQSIAKAYQAACTPDLFVFDAAKTLVYRGQFDSARPKSDTPVTGEDLSKALDTLLAGEPALATQKASLGCNIKWIAGNEPNYFG